MAHAVDCEIEAVVHQTLCVHARADAGCVHQVDRALFEHAGADARQHVPAALTFDDDGGYAGAVQHLSEQQARRSGADDEHLGA